MPGKGSGNTESLPRSASSWRKCGAVCAHAIPAHRTVAIPMQVESRMVFTADAARPNPFGRAAIFDSLPGGARHPAAHFEDDSVPGDVVLDTDEVTRTTGVEDAASGLRGQIVERHDLHAG